MALIKLSLHSALLTKTHRVYCYAPTNTTKMHSLSHQTWLFTSMFAWRSEAQHETLGRSDTCICVLVSFYYLTLLISLFLVCLYCVAAFLLFFSFQAFYSDTCLCQLRDCRECFPFLAIQDESRGQKTKLQLKSWNKGQTTPKCKSMRNKRNKKQKHPGETWGGTADNTTGEDRLAILLNADEDGGRRKKTERSDEDMTKEQTLYN